MTISPSVSDPETRPVGFVVALLASAVFRRTFSLALFTSVILASCSLAFALDPQRRIDQLYHSSWNEKDGITGAVTALAQTSDGYLWLSTTDGLLRFNGISFERYRPESGRLGGSEISAMLSVPDGGLWVGFGAGGASFLKNGRVTNYGTAQGLPSSVVRAFARDGTGAIWAAIVGGLARLDGHQWKTVHTDWNYPAKSATALFTDRQGNLWVATGSRIVVLQKGATRFADTGILCGTVYGFAQTVDGSIIFDDEGANLLRAVRLDSRGQVTRLPDIRVPAGAPLVDRDGSLWIPTSDGVVRVPSLDWLHDGQQQIELFTDKQGLSGNTTTQAMEDEEGNIWISTVEGVDRFRNRNVTWFPLPGVNFTLVEDSHGDVWAGSNRETQHAFLRVQDHRSAGPGPSAVYAVFRDRDGSIWYSGTNALMHWNGDRFVRVPVPAAVSKLSLSTRPGAPIIASSITRDNFGALWVAFGGSGEFRLEKDTWAFVPVLPEHPDWASRYAFTDDANNIWLCWGDRIAQVDRGSVRVYGNEQGLSVGPFNVVAGTSQRIWVGGESGVSVFENGQFHTVESAGSAEFRTITGIVVTRNDGVWLSSGAGIIHIPQLEVNALYENPLHKVSFDLFDTVSDLTEPLQANTVWSSGAIAASDGALWFASRRGAVRIDPAHTYKNPLPPPVTIASLIADGEDYSVFSSPTLRPLTENVAIRYDALSLTVPERVRFRYKLEGLNRDWHEAGGRREAFFTHLGPGRYVFRVTACNNDGVWNTRGASIIFWIRPAWYQTNWFLALCIIGALTILWILYKLRLRQIAATISARFDERLAERVRIARDLHDTVLQTIQGSKMVADEALDQCSEPQTRGTLEKLSVWLAQATNESRAALNSLRLSTTVRNDLADALRRASETSGISESMSVTFSAVGDPREMHPIVRDEVYRIAYEAIRNAQVHSHATQLGVELRYDRELIVSVHDNGIGIDPTVADHGKAGHYGLQGMRERAARIRGKLTITSSVAMGTKVLLEVPAVIAFSGEKLGPISRVRRFFMQRIERFR